MCKWLKEKYYSAIWEINFDEIADQMNLPRDKLEAIFDQYKRMFSSGAFDKDEFKTNFLKLGKNDDLKLDGVCDRFFKKYDRMETGKIKFADFVEMLKVQFYGTVEEKLALLFDLIDQNGNKHISEVELADMLTASYHQRDKSEPRKKATDLASKIFSVAHQDTVGQLSLEQFKLIAHDQTLFSDIYELFHPDFDTSTREEGEPPVHWMVRTKDYNKCLRLLLNGNDPNWKDKDGNTALHIAVQKPSCSFVKMLLVFGADVNLKDRNECSPRHLAATLNHPKKYRILELLRSVGASRCSADMTGCDVECRCPGAGEDCVDGVQSDQADQYGADNMYMECINNDSETVFDVASFVQMMNEVMDGPPKAIGDMVLCLDGGGIRGLILTQILLEIERILRDEFKSKLTIRECFDWIGGTSTGGILALAIAKGIKMEDCRKLYFEMKENVFEKSDTMSHATELVELLKIKFGAEVKLTELTRNSTATHAPKVLVTTVKIDKTAGKPGKLNLLRTYLKPKKSTDSTEGEPYDATDDANAIIQDVWEAAQATGAAPYYFPAVREIFVDGGMMANNPTLDVLTEIVKYREAHGQYKISVGAVMSLGTGNAPPQDLLDNHPVLKQVISKFGFIQNFKDFFQLILNEVTNTKETKETRSEAWCKSIHAAFFRINPPLKEFVDLSCTDDKQLINMLYSTKVYLCHHQEKLKEAAGLLLDRYKQRNGDK